MIQNDCCFLLLHPSSFPFIAVGLPLWQMGRWGMRGIASLWEVEWCFCYFPHHEEIIFWEWATLISSCLMGAFKASDWSPMLGFESPVLSEVGIFWIYIGCVLHLKTPGNWNSMDRTVFSISFTLFSPRESTWVFYKLQKKLRGRRNLWRKRTSSNIVFLSHTTGVLEGTEQVLLQHPA